MAFDLEIFNRQTHAVMVETIAQQTDLFNEKSQGTIQLTPKPFAGDFDIEASFKRIGDMVRRRDVKNGQNVIASKRLDQHTNTTVKVAAGTPELLWERAQFAWVQQNPEQAAIVIGQQLGEAQIADMLNTGIHCAVGAISGNAAAVNDATTAKTSFAALTTTAQKFGDRSQAIKAWVMHSGSMTDLYLNALNNNERVFEFDNIAVYRDQFGRMFIVTDAADLTYMQATTPPSVRYNTLGLTEGGIIVNGQNDFYAAATTETGKENITTTYQAEWSYAASVKGYSWNAALGGSNPTAAALGTSTNWTQYAESLKNTAGVLLKTM